MVSPDPMDAKIVFIKSARSKDFRGLFDIYSESMPPREQKKRSEIAALIARNDYALFVLKEGGEVLAFAIVFISASESMALLEYMGTKASARNRGLGERMFTEVLRRLAGRPLILEVDSERERSKDRAIRIRRKGFYRRLGCRQISALPYELPLAGEGSPPDMDLMVHFNGKKAAMRLRQLRRWLSAVYRDVYDQSENDTRIDAMLKKVEDPVKFN